MERDDRQKAHRQQARPRTTEADTYNHTYIMLTTLSSQPKLLLYIHHNHSTAASEEGRQQVTAGSL